MDDPCCEWPVLCRLASELRKKLQWREQKPRYVQSAGQHHHTRSTHSCPMHGSDALVYQHLRGRFGMHASRSYVWSVPVAHGTGGGQGGERARGVRRTAQGGGPGTSKGGGARGNRGACPSAHYQLMHTTGGRCPTVVPHFFPSLCIRRPAHCPVRCVWYRRVRTRRPRRGSVRRPRRRRRRRSGQGDRRR